MMVFSLAAAIAGLILLWFYYNLPYKLNCWRETVLNNETTV